MLQKCPFCGSVETTFSETISGFEINFLYARNFCVVNALKSFRLDYCVCQICNLGFFPPLDTGCAELYERLQKFDWYYMSNKWEYHFAKKYVTSNSNVLEVGCMNEAATTLTRAVLALLPSAFRHQNVSLAAVGEKHAWMYDFYMLEQLLTQADFKVVKRMSADSSDIPNFPFQPLDLTAYGQPRKGAESMYIEAVKF